MSNMLEHFGFSPGDKIDNYVLLEPIGLGGEASLWSALDGDNVVILKFILIEEDFDSPNSPKDRDSSLAGLTHPSIRKVYGSGTVGHFNYLCMQYYPLGSLRELILSGPLSIQEVLGLASQIANALDFLHSQGIVHRDLKPTNILIDVKRRVFLTDFGLARPLSQTTQMIHTGHGTAPYSPPEQHTKTVLRHESDIYSFGVLLYEMFTGTLPWGGQAALALRQLESGEQIPDPCDVNPRLPDGLVHALRILTNPDPDKRPSSAITAFGVVVASLRKLKFESLSRSFGRDAVNQVLQTVPKLETGKEWAVDEANYMFERYVQFWEPAREQYKLGLTNFAFMNVAYAEKQNGNLSAELCQFMTRGALAHGINHLFWWRALEHPATQLKVIENVIANEEPEVVERMLTMLISQPEQLADLGELSPLTMSKLIEFGIGAPTRNLRNSALEFLGLIIKPDNKWKNIYFSASDDTEIATLALSDNPEIAQSAARLIGKTQSTSAVKMLWNAVGNRGSREGLTALTEIYQTAGSLPRALPSQARMRIWFELIQMHFSNNRTEVLRALGASLLAGALGIGIHSYVGFRLPSLFSTARILSSLGSGLVIGPLIGLGFFVTRLFVRRFRIITSTLRTMIGILIGALIINFSIVVYHMLFLDSDPQGWLILLGSTLIALGFGLGSFFSRSKILPPVLSVASSAVGLGVSWFLAFGLGQTPMLYYESDQPGKTFTMIAATALIFGIFPYLYGSFKLEAETELLE